MQYYSPTSAEVAFVKIGQCKTQTVDYSFHHANEYVTAIVPLFSNPKNNSLQSVSSLHFTLCLSKLLPLVNGKLLRATYDYFNSFFVHIL